MGHIDLMLAAAALVTSHVTPDTVCSPCALDGQQIFVVRIESGEICSAVAGRRALTRNECIDFAAAHPGVNFHLEDAKRTAPSESGCLRYDDVPAVEYMVNTVELPCPPGASCFCSGKPACNSVYENCFESQCCKDHPRFGCFKRIKRHAYAECRPISQTCGPATLEWLCPGTWESKRDKRAMLAQHRESRHGMPSAVEGPPSRSLKMSTAEVSSEEWNAFKAGGDHGWDAHARLRVLLLIFGTTAMVCFLAAAAALYPRGHELLIFVCAPEGEASLPLAWKEAIGIQEHIPARPFGASSAHAGRLREVLRRRPVRRFHFVGHSDVQLGAASDGETSPNTLAFTTAEGRMTFVSAETVVSILKEHRGLEFVFINGCESLHLGKALRDGGVPHVVCWETKVEDTPAYHFAVEFYRALNSNNCEDYRGAFEAAKLAVESSLLRKGAEAGLRDIMIPKFELRRPGSPPIRACNPPPRAAGVPVYLSTTESRDDALQTNPSHVKVPLAPVTPMYRSAGPGVHSEARNRRAVRSPGRARRG